MSVRLRLEVDGVEPFGSWEAPFATYTWDAAPDGGVRVSVTPCAAPGDPELRRIREACLALLDFPSLAPAGRFELVQQIMDAAGKMSGRGRW